MQTTSSRSLVAQPDITLLLDRSGAIEKVTLSDGMIGAGFEAWIGRPWVDTVADVGGDKVRRMLDDARKGGVSGFRQLTQLFPSGLELPMEYTAVRLGARGGLIAIGKNLRAVAELQSQLIAAQQSMERDHWKLRDVETRYRLLFDVSPEAVVVIRAGNLRILEANPAALEALEIEPEKRERAAGRNLLPLIRSIAERAALRAMLQRISENGKSPGIVAHLGAERKAWLVRASLVAPESGPAFMLQLTPVGQRRQPAGTAGANLVAPVIENVPDGLVVIDKAGLVRWANGAFRDLAEIGSEATVVGEPLSRWMWRPGADVNALLSNVEKHRSIRMFSSIVHGEKGFDTEVEISAAEDAVGDGQHVALVVRDIGRRIAASNGVDNLGSTLNAIAEQIGKASLRDLVRDTVDIVEQHHIRAVLDLVGGNKTVAADRLGLSRQSLYAKMRRYGLDTDPRNDVEAAA